MANLAELLVALGLDSEGYTEGLDEAAKKTGGFANDLKNNLAALGGTIVTGGLAAAGAGVTALGGFLGYAMGEAMDAEGGIAQLQSVLESTGGAAGVTAEQALGLADSLSKVTKFSDDSVLAAENVLLTFTGIGSDVFPQVTEMAIDLSQAMGQDVKSSAIQLGKALNNPEEGMTALTRVGVTFTDEQKDMVKAMMEAGDVAGAQGIILAELQREFGGSAVAAGQTMGGQMEILRNRIANVSEGIGTSLMPMISNLLTAAQPLIDKVEQVAGSFSSWIEQMNSWGWDKLFSVFEDGSTLLSNLFEAFGMGEEKSNSLALGIIGVVNAVKDFGEKVSTWGKAFMEFIGPMIDNEGAIVAALAMIGTAIGTFVFTVMVPAAAAMIAAWGPVILVLGLIGAAAYLLYEAWVNDWGGIQEKTTTAIAVLTDLWENTLLPALKTFWDWVTNSLIPTFQKIWDWLSTNIPLAIDKLRQAWDDDFMGIRTIVEGAWEAIKNTFELFQAAFEGDWYKFGQKLRELVDGVGATLKEAFIQQVGQLAAMLYLKWLEIADDARNIDWRQLGIDIITGIINGLLAMQNALTEAAANVLRAMTEAMRGFLDAHSPSGLTMDIGADTGEGYIIGLSDMMAQAARAMPGIMSPIVPAMEGAGGVGGAGAMGGGGGIVVNFYYQPPVSLGDSYEAERVIMPWVEAGIRRAVSDGKVKGGAGA